MNKNKQYRVTDRKGNVSLVMGQDGVAELLGTSSAYVERCIRLNKPCRGCTIEELSFVFQSVEQMQRVLGGFKSESDKCVEFENAIRERGLAAYKSLCEENREMGPYREKQEMREAKLRDKYSGQYSEIEI